MDGEEDFTGFPGTPWDPFKAMIDYDGDDPMDDPPQYVVPPQYPPLVNVPSLAHSGGGQAFGPPDGQHDCDDDEENDDLDVDEAEDAMRRMHVDVVNEIESPGDYPPPPPNLQLDVQDADPGVLRAAATSVEAERSVKRTARRAAKRRRSASEDEDEDEDQGQDQDQAGMSPSATLIAFRAQLAAAHSPEEISRLTAAVIALESMQESDDDSCGGQASAAAAAAAATVEEAERDDDGDVLMAGSGGGQGQAPGAAAPAGDPVMVDGVVLQTFAADFRARPAKFLKENVEASIDWLKNRPEGQLPRFPDGEVNGDGALKGRVCVCHEGRPLCLLPGDPSKHAAATWDFGESVPTRSHKKLSRWLAARGMEQVVANSATRTSLLYVSWKPNDVHRMYIPIVPYSVSALTRGPLPRSPVYRTGSSQLYRAIGASIWEKQPHPQIPDHNWRAVVRETNDLKDHEFNKARSPTDPKFYRIFAAVRCVVLELNEGNQVERMIGPLHVRFVNSGDFPRPRSSTVQHAPVHEEPDGARRALPRRRKKHKKQSRE